jgi:hypothetical protein
MARMPGRFRRGGCGHFRCRLCRPGDARYFKRAEQRQVAAWIAELPDPSILDAYDEVVRDGKARMLALRSQSASWEEVGGVLDAAMRQVCRELQHEAPGWPA